MVAERVTCSLASIAITVLLANVASVATAGSLALRSGDVDLRAATPEHVAALLSEGHGESPHVVVQFSGPLRRDTRSVLEARGLRVLSYLGNGAFTARLERRVAAPAAIAATPDLVGIDHFCADWKLHPDFAAARPPVWAIVSGDAPGTRFIAAYVVFHDDVALDDGAELARLLGAAVVSRLNSINGLVVELPEPAVHALAASDIVQWIEPPLPPLSETNDGARERTGADLVQAAPYSLTGTGISVMVYDGGGARPTHVDFQGRVNVVDGSPTNAHATHVAGTIGGAGVANPLYRGMAPGATLLSYGLQGVGSSSPLYNDPGDMETDYVDAFTLGGAVISNNSIGANVDLNGFDCAWQGDYGVTSALIDAMVRGSLGAPLRVVWANGNERYSTRCDVEGFGSYYSISPPSGAKNHLTVGALNSNDDSMTAFSSWGPTDDGRLKPDVSAPGCQSGGNGSGIMSCSGYSDTEYISLCGTSMASPVVCGLSALLLEDFKARFPNQPLPRNSTLRAMFAHTAADLGHPGPDYQFGYGSVRVNQAVDLLRSARFGESYVDQDGTVSRTVVVEPGEPELRATLAWDDVPAAPNAAVTLVNDLDLVVLAPDGTRHYPWTLNPTAPSAPAVRTERDQLNNIEQVLVENPLPGTWTISVVGTNVPSGPQPFSLVGDGALNVATIFLFPNGLPDVVPPNQTRDLDVQIATFGQSITPGTATIFYRDDAGPFTGWPMTELGAGLYRAVLPAAACGATPQYYIQIGVSDQGVATYPPDAPDGTLDHSVGAWATFFGDDFETPQGWTVFAGAYSGNWERANPQQVLNLNVVTQPEDDHTPGAGQLCYVTGALAGISSSQYDLDGGPSHLISPVFDLASRDAIVSYWRWYHMSVALDDLLLVSITPDGVNWTTVEEVRRSASEWTHKAWRVGDYITPTATVQVRFTVNDTDPGSLIEALIDDFEIRYVACDPRRPGDLNCDNVVDFFDIDPLIVAFAGEDSYLAAFPGCYWLNGDCDVDGDVDFFDIDPFIALLGTEYP